MSRTITAAEAINDYFDEVKINGEWVATTGVGEYQSQIVGQGTRRRMIVSDVQLAIVTGHGVTYDAYGEHETTIAKLHSAKLAASDTIEVR